MPLRSTRRGAALSTRDPNAAGKTVSVSKPGQRRPVFHTISSQGASKPHQRTRSAPSMAPASSSLDSGVPASSLPVLAGTGTASASGSVASTSASRRTRASKRQREEVDTTEPATSGAGAVAGPAASTVPAAASPSRRAAKRGRTAGMIQDEEPCKFPPWGSFGAMSELFACLQVQQNRSWTWLTSRHTPVTHWLCQLQLRHPPLFQPECAILTSKYAKMQIISIIMPPSCTPA